MRKEMSEEDYLKLLKAHDWTYHYSDDHSVWKKGTETAQQLTMLAKDYANLEVMYRNYIATKDNR
jgi:hypothetical protein